MLRLLSRAEIRVGLLDVQVGTMRRRVWRMWVPDGLHIWWGDHGLHLYWCGRPHAVRDTPAPDTEEGS